MTLERHQEKMQDRSQVNFESVRLIFNSLRSEIIEKQKVQIQILGFKIIFTSTFMGVIVSSIKDGAPAYSSVIPAVVSVFFDFLILSRTQSMRRIGDYLEEYIEPLLYHDSSCGVVTWQSYLRLKGDTQFLKNAGELGFTLIMSVFAVLITLLYHGWWIGIAAFIIIAPLVALDSYLLNQPWRWMKYVLNSNSTD